MSDSTTVGSTGRGAAACRTGHAACSLPQLGIPTTTPRGEHTMSIRTTTRSNKERALSRASDALAGYMSDSRGWDYAITGREVFDAAKQGDIGDIESAAGDLIADLLHLTEHLHLTAVPVPTSPDEAREAAGAIAARGYVHYSGERRGDLDEAWNTITDPEYLPEVEA